MNAADGAVLLITAKSGESRAHPEQADLRCTPSDRRKTSHPARSRSVTPDERVIADYARVSADSVAVRASFCAVREFSLPETGHDDIGDIRWNDRGRAQGGDASSGRGAVGWW
jgi:hypothetical protein